MTTQELTEIKSAAERIHAASVAAGKWDPKPEWEARLMDIVCDISRAAEADKEGKHADMERYYKCVNGLDSSTFIERANSYPIHILGTVEDHLADAVIDILDTAEGFELKWDFGRILHRASDIDHYSKMSFNGICQLMVGIVGTADLDSSVYYHLFRPLEILRWWCPAHGIDLRRHVELKMKYNETGR